MKLLFVGLERTGPARRTLRVEPLAWLTPEGILPSSTLAGSVVELDGGKLYEHSTRAGGLVEAYLEGKAKRLADSQSAASAARSQLRDELAWLRRGAKARQSKSTERIARVHVLQHKAEDVKQRGDLGLEAGAADDARRTEERRKRTVVTIDDLGAKAGVATVDGEDYEERLFDEFSYEIAHNDRIGVVGANGAGKSTLVNALAGWSRGEPKASGTLCALITSPPLTTTTND